MMSRHLYLAVFALALLHSLVQADGLPYSTGDTGERTMHGDFIALKISAKQIEEISKSGAISFDEKQLKKLRAIYPLFPIKAGVASSTFNDNLERFETVADVIWWYADEVRVPLFQGEVREQVEMPNQEAWCPLEDALVRMDPNGAPYRKGQKTSIRELLAVIDQVAAMKVKRPYEIPSLRVIVPPPHSGWAEADKDVLKELFSENMDAHPNKVIPRIFDLLEAYAHARGIELHKSW